MNAVMNTSTDRTPYTYLIGWKELDTWYFGARWAEGCNPNDLFNPYRTSSTYVKAFIKQHGKPDVISVIDVFKTKEMAQDYESRIIRLFDIVKDERFLNKKDPKGGFYPTGTQSNEHKARIAAAMKEVMNRSEVKEKYKANLQAARAKYNARPDVIAKRNEQKRLTAERNAERLAQEKAARDEYNARPDVIAMKHERRSKAATEAQNRPEVKAKIKEYNNRPEVKQKSREIQKRIAAERGAKQNESKNEESKIRLRSS